ncbi:hypothetical protein GGI20_001013 [Coemansia sp. BCRC 34301]|nr:hypothetical protein GGI20_001013 [Coemansia sp. BCRC 34301]
MPMHSLSAFQLLPPHVVRRIVDRVVRKTRLLYGCVWEDTVEYKKLLRPLLLVCSSFRAVAYPLYCCRFDLGLSSVLNDGSEPWVTRSNPFGLPYPTLHLVKDLYMNTVEISFYSGEALEALSRTLVGSCVFPLVQNLTICIAADVSDDEDGPSVHGLYNAIDPGTVDANISAFVQRVKEMMPMLSKVRLEFKIGSHLPIRRHTGRLILQIFQLAGRIEYIDPAEEAVPFALEAGGTRQMTHIKCNIMNFDGQFMLLVRLNAPTLQSLDLGGKLTHPASALIRNDDGSHVTYPQLATLNELSAYVIATYAPIGKRFRCLDVMGNIDLGNYASMAKSALLLALVCPGFRYLVTRIPRDAKFKDEVEKAIDSDMFKQYAPRLQNLVIYSYLSDASASTIKPRSLIYTTDGWSKADVDELKRFVAAYFADSSTIDWKFVGAFMSVDVLECQRVGQSTYKDTINAVAYRRICECRVFGRCWKDIHQHFHQYSTCKSVQDKFPWFKGGLEGRLETKYATKWTDDERERAMEIVRQHQASMATPELVDVVQRELLHKPAGAIVLMPSMVKAGTESAELGVLTSRALRSWIKYGEGGGKCVDWSFDDTLQLQHLTEAGIKPKEAAKKQDMDDGEHAATSEARKQLESGSIAVDWLQVSQATGLGFCECLEQSQYDVDKTPWHYDPNSFSQSTVDRITSFIEEHYPAPTPVNY